MLLDERFLSSNTLQLHTDVAQSKGFAGIYKAQWFYGDFPESGKYNDFRILSYCHCGQAMG